MHREFGALILGFAILIGASRAADDAPMSRYGVQQTRNFPQSTPKEILASVLKAVEIKRHDYLLAHLADPDWVDARVEALSGGFKDAVKEAEEKLDSRAAKQLKRFLDEGDIETLDSSAVVRLKDSSDRVVRLRKINKRWFLQQSNRP
jgi:hypothetical protein